MKFQKPSVPVRVCSILLGILLALSLFLSGVLGILRTALSAEGVRSSVARVDITDIRVPSSAKPSVGAAVHFSGDNSVSISEYLIEALGDDVAEQYNLTPKRVDALLARSAVNDFLSDVIARYTATLVSGAPLDALTADEVVDFIRENAEIIELELNYTLTAEDYAKLRSLVSKNLDKYLGFLGLEPQPQSAALAPSPVRLAATPAPAKNASSEIDGALSALQTLLSGAVTWALVGISALLLGLIVALNLRSALCGLRTIYIAMFATAFLFTLVSVAMFLLPSLLSQPQIAALLTAARGAAILYGVIFLLVGAAALVCCILLKHKAKATPLPAD